jgi:mono/diheme cytochrome c family protein
MKEPENLHSAARHSSTDHADYRENVDVTRVHAAVQREKRDPDVGEVPLPMWLIVFCGWMLVLGGVYLGMFSGGFSGEVFDETSGQSSLSAIQKAGSDTGEAAVAKTLAQQGKSVFGSNCAQCHQASGLGVAGQFPPLAGSEWVTGDPKRLTAILLKGLQGPFVVEGKQFNGAMPPWEAVLTDKKIAAVASYIRQEWGNKADEITPEEVASSRQEFSARKEPWTQAEAEKIQAPAPAALESAAADKK